MSSPSQSVNSLSEFSFPDTPSSHRRSIGQAKEEHLLIREKVKRNSKSLHRRERSHSVPALFKQRALDHLNDGTKLEPLEEEGSPKIEYFKRRALSHLSDSAKSGRLQREDFNFLKFKELPKGVRTEFQKFCKEEYITEFPDFCQKVREIQGVLEILNKKKQPKGFSKLLERERYVRLYKNYIASANQSFIPGIEKGHKIKTEEIEKKQQLSQQDIDQLKRLKKELQELEEFKDATPLNISSQMQNTIEEKVKPILYDNEESFLKRDQLVKIFDIFFKDVIMEYEDSNKWRRMIEKFINR
ncbi:MAG: hypothetical protein WD595_05995 [Waddliaceae bacterium]